MNKNSLIFKKALAALDATGAQYRIIMPDGTHYGTLPYAAPQPERPAKARRKLKHPWGVLKQHYAPYVEDLKPGSFVEIPWGNFLGESLMSAVSAYGCKNWGNGNCTCALNRERKVIEVLRNG